MTILSENSFFKFITHINKSNQFRDRLRISMFPPLQETLKKPRLREEITADGRNFPHLHSRVNCKECKHAIFLSEEIYCGMKKKRVTLNLQESCPNFEQMTLAYKVFKRS